MVHRCFPAADRVESQTILELVGTGGASVVVLYEYELKNGERIRNTEFTTACDDQLVEAQVFFGGRVR